MMQKISRRDFLKIAGISTAGLVLTACNQEISETVLPTQKLIPTITHSLTNTVNPNSAQMQSAYPLNESTEIPKITQIPITLRQAGERIGFQIGNTFYSDDLGAYRSDYKERSIKHFSGIWSQNEFTDEAIKQYGDEGIRRVLEIANDGNQELIVNGFFYRIKIPAELQGLPDDASLPERVESNMRARLKYVFPYLKNRKKMTYFVGNHETIDIYQGERLWDSEDIWYRAFGEDVFIRTGEIMFDEAVKAGLIPGKDILFMIGLTDMLFPGAMLDFGTETFIRAKNALADRLKIPYAQVPLGIAAEGHAVQKGTVRGHFSRPTREQMLEAMTRMIHEGPVYLTEVELQNATAGEVGGYLCDIAISGYQAGVAGTTLWAAIRSCINQPEPGWCNPDGALFDQNGMPTDVYQMLLSSLNAL
jgi:hypothetical protein